MNLNKLTVIFSLFILFLPNVYGQSSELRGFVYDEKTGDPVPLANVYVKGAEKGASSDFNGYYVISKLKPGKYRVLVTSIGFDSTSFIVNLEKSKVLSKNIYVKPMDYQLGEIEINEKRSVRKSQAKVSKIKITPEKIKRIPSVGGTADFAQYIQILPGVVFSGDQGGQLYVRGGSPIQNKVILDGMTIYNPFHSIGLFSVFDVDIINSIDVYTGGYPAEYGGRISAIMDIKTRDGNRKNIAGHVEGGPFASKIMIEGPLKEMTTDKSSSSFIFSTRSSYLNKTAPIFYNYADSNGLPYVFNDYYGKYSVRSPSGSKFDVFGFSFNDDVKFENATNYNWDAVGIGTKMMFLPSNSSSVVEAHFAWSKYEMTQIEVDNSPRFSSISGFEGGVDFSYFMGDNHFKYGIGFVGFNTDFTFTNSVGRSLGQRTFTSELAGYLHYKLKKNRLILEPGLRMHYFASHAELSPEPRLMGKYNVSENFRIKFASGLYAQNLLSATSDRDVVNLFNGMLSGPDELPSEFRGEAVKSNLQKAAHLIGGIELDLGENLMVNVEGFYKRFTQLTNINRNKIFDNTLEYADEESYYKNDYLVEKGDAYGGDVTVEYEKDRFYLWAVYTLTWVTREDEKINYNPHWDRRHNVNILASYLLGEKRHSELSVRWNFGSGFPFTETQGFYEHLDFGGGIGTDYLNSNGDLGIHYAGLNQGRLTSYHRLDVAYKWWKEYKKDRKLELNVSVSNAYNRENIFYFDRVNHTQVNQLPILPSVGIGYYF